MVYVSREFSRIMEQGGVIVDISSSSACAGDERNGNLAGVDILVYGGSTNGKKM